MWPDAHAVRAFLTRSSRRLAWLAVARGAAAGLGLAAVLVLGMTLLGRTDNALIAIALLTSVALTLGIVVALRRPRPIPRLVEARAPQCRNIVITAAELIEQPSRVRPHIGKRVCRDAAEVLSALDPAALFPARRAIVGVLGAAAVWIVALLLVTTRPARSEVFGPASTSALISDIDVTVTPPAYLSASVTRLQNPARIAAVAGSRITLRVRAQAAALTIETLSGRQSAARGDQVFTGEVGADADGYIALEPTSADGRAGVRRLIGLSVTADAPPAVRVTAPGRDLLLPDANRTIEIAVEAHDDYALSSLVLRYTKVTGSEEQFSFTDGDVPVTIVRTDAKTWTARGSLRLNTLGLVPGDLVVYRGAAADRRPGVRATESDAFIAEIIAPGSIPMEGFAIDDDRDRYALSQQMVVMKTERLIARAASMPPDSLAREALTLASEQRSVRAEFVFMMGGELAEEVLAAAGVTDLNEEAHVEAEEEAALRSTGRLALVLAIRFMSRANTALTATQLERALVEEKAALVQLQRAFSRTRYILRALTRREQLDLTRRLTGDLSASTRYLRPASAPTVDPRITTLRSVLAEIAGIAGGQARAESAVSVSTLSQRVLQVDPAATELQQVATLLNDAATAIAADKSGDARALLDRAAVQLSGALRTELATAPSRSRSLDSNRLEGVLTDALRQAGARR